MCGFRSRRPRLPQSFKMHFEKATRPIPSAGLWIYEIAAAATRGLLWPGLARCSAKASPAFLLTRRIIQPHGGTRMARPGWKSQNEIWLFLKPPYKLSVPNARVAVLTDIGVASSGEAIAIAFRGRPNTRSFGTPTCGLSTAVDQFPLSTGGRMAVVTGV